jgi:hypothetical protein
LSDYNAGISGTVSSLRAGINPAPTKRVDPPELVFGASKSLILGKTIFFTSIFCGSLFYGSAVHILKDLIADSYIHGFRMGINEVVCDTKNGS